MVTRRQTVRTEHAPGTAAEPGRLSLQGIRRAFRRPGSDPVVACDGIDLDVEPGEFLVLLGPSGCGKTTLLRILAGLDRPDEGTITIGPRTMFDSRTGVSVPPERRSVGMVFQSYALWPHMTVFENVAYPLRAARVPKAEITERVARVLALADVSAVVDRVPSQLSGGQQQRVALARAIVAGNDVVLFDEPLSNVDAKVRSQLRDELRAMHQRVSFTAVYVTHDQQEAMSLATRLLVLDSGRVLQDGPPSEVYRRPASLEVARFIGAVDEFPGRRTDTGAGGRVTVRTAVGDIDGCPPVPLTGTDVTAVVRPHAWRVLSGSEGLVNGVRGVVRSVSFQGERLELLVDVGDTALRVWIPPNHDARPGREISLVAEAAEVMVYDS